MNYRITQIINGGKVIRFGIDDERVVHLKIHNIEQRSLILNSNLVL